MKKGIRLTIISSLISLSLLSFSQQANALEVKHNLGAGIGIPFAIFGVSYELETNITDSFAIGPTIAVGTTLLAGSSTELGLQLHFGHKNNLIRFGASYWSGTNTLVETGFEDYTSVKGESAGINLRIQLGSQRKHCIDVHILKTLNPDDNELRQSYGSIEREGSNAKLGLGYVHRF